MSVQTGHQPRRHPAAGGGVAAVKLDFEVLRVLGEVGRADYGIAGAVQHGASTLPDELFHRFPGVETAEIHLATGFQNALYEHPAFPAELHAEIEAWCFANAADERKAGQTDTQFVYTTRKKAIGPFKRQLWELATKDEILAARAPRSSSCSSSSRSPARPTCSARARPVEWHRPLPESLRAATSAAEAIAAARPADVPRRAPGIVGDAASRSRLRTPRAHGAAARASRAGEARRARARAPPASLRRQHREAGTRTGR